VGERGTWVELEEATAEQKAPASEGGLYTGENGSESEANSADIGARALCPYEKSGKKWPALFVKAIVT